jgi:hypothetical protein
MDASQIHLAARQLFEADGPRALARAARKLKELERQGDSEAVRDWRRVEAALALMAGPHAS